MINAWYSAYFARVKQLPNLDDFLMDDEQEKPKEQTADQMLEALKGWTAALGGKVEVIDGDILTES